MSKYFWPRGSWSIVSASFSNMRQADGVAIHHAGTGGTSPVLSVARLRALENGERIAGYSALAYHRVIAPDGGVAESRPYGKMGAATGGHNDHTIALMLDGNFEYEVPTDVAIEAAADEIVWCVLFGFLNPNFVVRPHSEWTAGTKYATACPGRNLRPRVNGFASIEAIARWKLANAASLPTPVVPVSAPAPAPRCVKVSSKRTLRRGNSGVTVRTLQNLLRSRGFDPGPTDGVFGAKTDAAVRCAQKANGLVVDGIVGPATWAALGA